MFRVLQIGEKIERDISATFTIKEVEKMPKEFKKDFKAGRVTAHVRQRANGTFEIRCQYKHKKITASAKTLAEAKERFILKLETPQERKVQARSVKFTEYVEKWLKTTKEPFVKPVSLQHYKEHLSHAHKAFGGCTLASITQTQLQEFFNGISDKSQTSRALLRLLKNLFANAVGDGIITKSPMVNVRIQVAPEKHGTAFTRAEEFALVARLRRKPTLSLQCMVLSLYTGLRRSEVLTAKRQGEWIVTVCAKQKKSVTQTRRVPISPMLEQVIDLIDFARLPDANKTTMSIACNDYFPSHHFHDLRHTFITRCQECGIRRELVSLWAGHAADSSITSTVYTHFEQNEALQLAEIAKCDYALE